MGLVEFLKKSEWYEFLNKNEFMSKADTVIMRGVMHLINYDFVNPETVLRCSDYETFGVSVFKRDFCATVKDTNAGSHAERLWNAMKREETSRRLRRRLQHFIQKHSR